MTQSELEHEREVTAAAIDNLSITIKRTNRELSDLGDSDEYWRDQLLHTRSTLRYNQKNLRKFLRELQVLCTNVDTILNPTHQQNRNTEKEQDL